MVYFLVLLHIQKCSGDFPPPDNCEPCLLIPFNDPDHEEIVQLIRPNSNSVDPRRIGTATTELSYERFSSLVSSVYPNPFNKTVVLDIWSADNQDIQIQLFNLMGQTKYSTTRFVQQGDNSLRLDFSKQLPVGLYHLLIEDEAGNRNIHKLVHQ